MTDSDNQRPKNVATTAIAIALLGGVIAVVHIATAIGFGAFGGFQPDHPAPAAEQVEVLTKVVEVEAVSEELPVDVVDDAAEIAEPAEKERLTRDDVKNTIMARADGIRTCAREDNSDRLTGVIEVRFLVRPDGSVHEATVERVKFHDTDIGRCVQKVVESLRFPATTANSDLPVLYPFIIK